MYWFFLSDCLNLSQNSDRFRQLYVLVLLVRLSESESEFRLSEIESESESEFRSYYKFYFDHFKVCHCKIFDFMFIVQVINYCV